MYKSKLIFLSLFAFLSGCDNYNHPNDVSNISATPSVNGTFITGLPSNAVAGDIYPVAFSASLNYRLDEQLEEVIETDNLDVESSSVDCLTLGQDDQHLCTIALRVKPIRNGASSVSLNFRDKTYTSQSSINDSAIIGYVKTNGTKSFTTGSEKFEIGKSYPIEFVFINVGHQKANNISIKPLTGTSLSNVNSDCSTTLEAGRACYIRGEYLSTSDDFNGFQYQLDYTQGAPVVLGVRNTLQESTLLGSVVTGLPLNIAVDTSYDIEFEFKNKGLEPATNLITHLLASDTSEIRSDNCSGETLESGDSCSLTASITAEHIGTLTALVAVYSEEEMTGYATVTSNAVESPIVVYVEQDLPQSMALGVPYSYLVTFSNSSKNHDATGIRFAHLYPESYDILSDTCTDSTLKAEESCHMSITTSALTPGLQRYSSYLSFDQGTAVIASSLLSKASEQSLESEVDVNFPTNMLLNHSYPFHVTFTNTGTIDSGELELSSSTTDGVTIDYNTCEASLAPGESCLLSGEYFTTTKGPVRLEGNLNYGLQKSETFTLVSEVVSIPIEGKVKVGLPHNIGINNTYPVSYTYRNLSDSHDATMVDVVLSSTAPVHVVSNTCAATKVLHAGEECEISGEFTANDPGQHQFTSSLRYKEGNEVLITSFANVSEVVVSSHAEGLLDLVGHNEKYDFVYKFTNESILDATGIEIHHSDDLNIVSNSCGSTLAHNEECQVEVEYTPSTLGYHTYNLIFDYIEGHTIDIEQAVKVVDFISIPEAIFEDGSLTHSFDAGDFYDFRANYGFTLRSKLQTIAMSGNPEAVIWNKWGSTPLVFELSPGEPIDFIATRVNLCGESTMNSSAGCQGKVLPEFRLKIDESVFDGLPVGTHNGEIYVSLAQSNNLHMAIFKLPIKVIKN
jgi:hypothetical protein